MQAQGFGPVKSEEDGAGLDPGETNLQEHDRIWGFDGERGVEP